MIIVNKMHPSASLGGTTIYVMEKVFSLWEVRFFYTLTVSWCAVCFKVLLFWLSLYWYSFGYIVV